MHHFSIVAIIVSEIKTKVNELINFSKNSVCTNSSENSELIFKINNYKDGICHFFDSLEGLSDIPKI